MTDLKTMTVSDIAHLHPESYRVFFKHDIDFCCGGQQKLAEVCERKDKDMDAVINDLLTLIEQDSDETDWTQASQTDLIDHIVKTHHQYLKDELPRLYHLAEKVARVHGDHDIHLREVFEVFSSMARELISHLEKEENVLFPYINAFEVNDTLPPGDIRMPIRMMEAEHEDTGADLEKLATLTGNYELTPGMCASYQALYRGLKDLAEDIQIHIHKENNILFPRAVSALKKSA